MELWIAGASLALSLYVLVTTRLANRAAHLEARWERRAGVDPNGKARSRSYLVLVNHGPSIARTIGVRLTDREGADTRVTIHSAHALPLPELSPGQDFHLLMTRALGADLGAAELTWKDGRLQEQRSRVWLSEREVFSPAVVNVEVLPENPTRPRRG